MGKIAEFPLIYGLQISWVSTEDNMRYNKYKNI
jgi:hypothetical protein